MIRFYFLIFFIVLFNSCNEPDPNVIFPEKYHQIHGHWEFVSESYEYYINGKLEESSFITRYPWGEQNGDTTFLIYLNFKNYGRVSKESESGFEYVTGYRWGVTDDNKFWFTSGVSENKSEIHLLNDTSFLFTHTYTWDDTFDMHSSGIHVEISTFSLKR